MVGTAALVRVHRPELQGLRAVAVTLVVVYHVWFGRVSGGVDVFFVVSGFLITTLLVREHDRTGRVDLLGFWTRRARRLLPALLVLVLSVILLARLVVQTSPRHRQAQRTEGGHQLARPMPVAATVRARAALITPPAERRLEFLLQQLLDERAHLRAHRFFQGIEPLAAGER